MYLQDYENLMGLMRWLFTKQKIENRLMLTTMIQQINDSSESELWWHM